METKPLTFVIPWDFTPVAENAFKYAVKLSKVSNEPSQIDLVHVLHSGGSPTKSGKTSEEQVQEMIQADKQRLSTAYSVEINTKLLEGSLFDVITDYASEVHANMVIMGTHGIKGVQKLTGSWALKVIAGSDVPFLVVQDEPAKDRIFSQLVMSIDFRDEEKEKILWASRMAKQYGSKIHVIVPNSFDSGVKKKISNNLAFAKKQFENVGISWEQHNAAKGKSFQEEIVNLAVDLEADLILIMTAPNLDFTDYVFGAQEQYIIANRSKIPVMCINFGTINP